MSIFSKKIDKSADNQKNIIKPEEWIKLITENTSDLISITKFSLGAKFLYLNSAHTKLLGYKKNELLGTSGMDLIHPDDQIKLRPLLAKYLKEKTLKILGKESFEVSEKIEYRIKDKQNKWHLLSSTVNAVDNKIIFISKDITKQKKIEQALKVERNKLQMYLNLVAVIILALDKKGQVVLINKVGSKILEYKKSEIINKNWFDNFIPKEQKQAVKTIFSQLMLGKEKLVEYYENEIVTKTDKKKLIAWHNTFLRNDKGEIIGVLSSGNDISEQKKMQEKIIKSEQEWSKTFDSMSDGISLHSPDHIIINANQSLCNLLDKTKDELIGKKCFTIFHNKDNPIEKCPMTITLKTTKAKQVEIFEPKFNKWLSVYTSPILDKKGQVEKIIHVVRDISERKQNEEEFIKRNKELKQFNKIMVGRELKMTELKKKIKELENK